MNQPKPAPKRDYIPWLAVVALVLAVLAALLTGCAQPTLKPVCPALVKYSPEQQKALAAELKSHPDMKEAPLFIMDYATERDELREACE